MKFIFILLSIIALTNASYLKIEKAQRANLNTNSCSVDSIYYTYQPTNKSKNIEKVLEKETPALKASSPSTFYEEVNYSPYVVYKTNSRSGTNMKFSVISDRDVKNFNVKGTLFWRDVKNGENWYSHDKVTERPNLEFEACKKAHREQMTKKFHEYNNSNKLYWTFPNSLSIKEANYERSPKILGIRKTNNKTNETSEKETTIITTNLVNPQTNKFKDNKENKQSNRYSILDINIDKTLSKETVKTNKANNANKSPDLFKIKELEVEYTKLTNINPSHRVAKSKTLSPDLFEIKKLDMEPSINYKSVKSEKEFRENREDKNLSPNLFKIKHLDKDKDSKLPAKRGKGDVTDKDLRPLPLTRKSSSIETENKPLDVTQNNDNSDNKELTKNIAAKRGRGDVTDKDLRPLPLTRKITTVELDKKPLDITQNNDNISTGNADNSTLREKKVPNHIPLKRRFMEDKIKLLTKDQVIKEKSEIKYEKHDIKAEDLYPLPLEKNVKDEAKIVKEKN